MTKKYQQPNFLIDFHSQADYEKWLTRKAHTHFERDKKRGNTKSTNKEYKEAIHQAVCECGELDVYTGERLNWNLLSKWNNEEAKKGRRKYKKKFALLPSVDHVGDGTGSANFKICVWRTNDAKNDLSLNEFVKLCQKVVEKNT
ncbi:Protein export cytoplasm protein SecA ATPase RNA helicase (TC 3.A.5.1.1) [uncultured Candidatus Thioglobus sp.]|nr:Protein export cytoplasm protein SecA ATPase RNA helicase (TC 3.A.5.1.1) [uncultured Candidatus Thioglobus sp.]